MQENAKRGGTRINLAVFKNSQNKLTRKEFAENTTLPARPQNEVDILLKISVRNWSFIYLRFLWEAGAIMGKRLIALR